MNDVAEVPAPPPDSTGAVDEVIDFKDQSVQFKFKRLKDRVPGESWMQMVYGASKTGKTFYAGTAGPRTLFLNIGEGIETLMAPGFTTKYPQSKGMIVVDIREQNPNGMAEAFDMTTDVIDHALKHFPDQFDNVILDEATAFRNIAMNKATELNTGDRSNKRPNRMTEYMKIDIGDYGEEMKMVEWLLSQYIPIFKGAGKNFLLLAHERQIFAKPGKIGDEPVLKRVVPGFTGKTFPDKVPSFFDDVFRSEVITDGSSNAQYRLRTAGNDQEMAGVRHGGVFNIVELNPDYNKLLDRIKAAQPKPQISIRR